MAWIDKIKWWLVGFAVVSLSIAIYFVFKGDDKKKHLQDLTKWSIKKRGEILNEVIDNRKNEVEQDEKKIEEIKTKIEVIKEERHAIETKLDAKKSNRELSDTWKEVMSSLN